MFVVRIVNVNSWNDGNGSGQVLLVLSELGWDHNRGLDLRWTHHHRVHLIWHSSEHLLLLEVLHLRWEITSHRVRHTLSLLHLSSLHLISVVVELLSLIS